jgi:tetratricopeptide (TPR) repeat protein
MSMWVKTSLVVALGLALAGPALHAQEKEVPPLAPEDSWKFTSPSPAKSVEIGNYYLRRKKLKAALSRFQEAVKTDPHYAPAYLGLGKVYEKIGLKQKALEAYERYLDELPSTKDAEEAKGVQEAVVRLQKQVKPAHHPASN